MEQCTILQEDPMKRLQGLITLLLVTTLPACARQKDPVASAAIPSATVTVPTTPVAAPASAQDPKRTDELAGTSWKLVKLQTGDEETHVPDDASKYTITFGANGRVTTRVDCNQASSTWKS